MIEHQQRHNNGMGLQKIESFFSDIFGCGGCSFAVVPNKRTPDSIAGRSYSNHRPIDSALHQHEFYKSQSHKVNGINLCDRVKGVNLCGGRQTETKKDQRWNRDSKQTMIACDEDNVENSLLNDTATTQPESFLLDDSCFSLPSTITFQERPVPRGPLQAVEDPSGRLPQQKVGMLPIETKLEVWPPLLPLHANDEGIQTGHSEYHHHHHHYYQQQQQQHLRRQQQQHVMYGLESSPHDDDDDEFIPPIPVRPPKIRRLKLDDAFVSSGQHPTEQFHNYEPTRDANGTPCVPASVHRSRSLDFLFSSNKPHTNRSKSRREVSQNHSHYFPLHSSDRSWGRYDEEERTRHQLLEMLSDLNETYATL